MVKAKEAHAAVYANYKRAFKEKYGVDWQGDDNTIEEFFQNASGAPSGADQDQWVLEDMERVNGQH